MQLSGKLIKILPLQTGTGKNGEWKKQDFVIETAGQFPKKACFSSWGDRIPSNSVLQEGNMLKVEFDVESREYNGRWYTDLRAWKVESETDSSAQGYAGNEPPVIDINSDRNSDTQEEDDLPF